MSLTRPNRLRSRVRSPFSFFFLTTTLPLLLLLSLLFSSRRVNALAQTDLRQRAIYQLITDRFATSDGSTPDCDASVRRYCGGTWKGIEAKLEYIQGMGFDTVWISPVVANVPTEDSYHGYFTSNLMELNERFGSKQDLLDLSAALHERGMYLMVDVVANHVGTVKEKEIVPGEMYGPFKSEQDFHPYCYPTDWENQTQIEKCWIADNLADLDTESPYVISVLYTWIKHLVNTFGIDAIRVDTVKHVRKSFWAGFVRSAGVAALGEALHGDPGYLKLYQAECMDSILDFATFFHLRRAFNHPSAPIDELSNMINQVHSTLPDPTMLGSFLDNHDFPRFAGQVHDAMLVKNAAVYPFVSDGFPVVYSGQEHGLTSNGMNDPHNREAIWLHGFSPASPLYSTFTALNLVRKRAIASHPTFSTTLLRHHRLSNTTLALSKPPLVSVLTSAGSASPITAHHLVPSVTRWKPLMAITDVLSGDVFATDPRGAVTVPLIGGAPRVLVPLSVWESQADASAWMASPPTIDTGVGVQGRVGSAPGSPQSPAGSSHRKRPSLGAALSWFRSHGSKGPGPGSAGGGSFADL